MFTDLNALHLAGVDFRESSFIENAVAARHVTWQRVRVDGSGSELRPRSKAVGEVGVDVSDSEGAADDIDKGDRTLSDDSIMRVLIVNAAHSEARDASQCRRVRAWQESSQLNPFYSFKKRT